MGESVVEPVPSPKSEEGRTIREGSCELVYEPGEKVFYNPVQEFNRDITILAVRTFSRVLSKEKRARPHHPQQQEDSSNPVTSEPASDGFRLLEALSASGLRAIRIAKEVPGVREVVANDLDARAVEVIKRNVRHNHSEEKITVTHSDASLLMLQNRRAFTVVDLDPYGTPAPFLDSAVQAVQPGGLLCVTATDMAILCGNAPEKCLSVYGALSVKRGACHEIALRILLRCLESHANRYGRFIEPLLCLRVDFYVRLFLRIQYSPSQAKRSGSKMSHLLSCPLCQSFDLWPLMVVPDPSSTEGKQKYTISPPPPGCRERCRHCGGRVQLAGPVWSDPIHSHSFIEEMLATLRQCSPGDRLEVNTVDDPEDASSVSEDDASENPTDPPLVLGTQRRIEGMLTLAAEELSSSPLYYVMNHLCGMVKTRRGKDMDFRSALLNSGYSVSCTHANKNGFKTNAPPEFMWDLVRAWRRKTLAEEKRPQKKRATSGTERRLRARPGTEFLLAKDTVSSEEAKISFVRHPDAVPASKKNRSLLRYQMNPARNWGPKTKRQIAELGPESENPKRAKHQNKRKDQIKSKECVDEEVVQVDKTETESMCS